MKNIDFKEKFNELNSNKFHYVFDDATGTLMLDENMNLNNVQLPEGYTLGADKNQGFGIYNSDNERILNVDDYGLNSLFDDEEESEELTSEPIDEEEYESEEYLEDSVDETTDFEESEELTSEPIDEEEYDLADEKIRTVVPGSNNTSEEEYELDNKKIEIIEPRKKGIFHMLSVPFIFIKEKVKHLGNKIKDKSKKEEYDLKPVKIPTITKIEKKGLKKLSKKDDEIKLSKEYLEWLSFKSLNLDEKIDKYLEKTDVGNDLLIQIYKLVGFIIDNRKGMETEKEIDIHKFLNENINIPSEEKLEKFVNFLKENALLIYNFKVTVIRKMLDNHNLDNSKEIQQLFNELIETEDFFKVQQLYNFMKKNVENEDFEKELLKKMYSILGKTRSESNLNNNEVEKEAEEKTEKEAEGKTKKEAEEKARKETEEKARKEAEEKARKEAEEKARKEAEEKARIDYTLNVLEKCGINMSIPEHVYGNSNSYKNIYILLKLAKLYGSEEELEKAKDIYNNDYNTFTISQREEIKQLIEISSRELLSTRNIAKEEYHMFNVNGLANRQVGDMTNCNILYKELMEKIQLGLLYNSKTIIDIERQRFEVLGNYLTIRQNEDLKQIFENANRNLNDNSLTLR